MCTKCHGGRFMSRLPARVVPFRPQPPPGWTGPAVVFHPPGPPAKPGAAPQDRLPICPSCFAAYSTLFDVPCFPPDRVSELVVLCQAARSQETLVNAASALLWVIHGCPPRRPIAFMATLPMATSPHGHQLPHCSSRRAVPSFLLSPVEDKSSIPWAAVASLLLRKDCVFISPVVLQCLLKILPAQGPELAPVSWVPILPRLVTFLRGPQPLRSLAAQVLAGLAPPQGPAAPATGGSGAPEPPISPSTSLFDSRPTSPHPAHPAHEGSAPSATAPPWQPPPPPGPAQTAAQPSPAAAAATTTAGPVATHHGGPSGPTTTTLAPTWPEERPLAAVLAGLCLEVVSTMGRLLVSGPQAVSAALLRQAALLPPQLPLFAAPTGASPSPATTPAPSAAATPTASPTPAPGSPSSSAPPGGAPLPEPARHLLTTPTAQQGQASLPGFPQAAWFPDLALAPDPAGGEGPRLSGFLWGILLGALTWAPSLPPDVVGALLEQVKRSPVGFLAQHPSLGRVLGMALGPPGNPLTGLAFEALLSFLIDECDGVPSGLPLDRLPRLLQGGPPQAALALRLLRAAIKEVPPEGKPHYGRYWALVAEVLGGLYLWSLPPAPPPPAAGSPASPTGDRRRSANRGSSSSSRPQSPTATQNRPASPLPPQGTGGSGAGALWAGRPAAEVEEAMALLTVILQYANAHRLPSPPPPGWPAGCFGAEPVRRVFVEQHMGALMALMGTRPERPGAAAIDRFVAGILAQALPPGADMTPLLQMICANLLVNPHLLPDGAVQAGLIQLRAILQPSEARRQDFLKLRGGFFFRTVATLCGATHRDRGLSEAAQEALLTYMLGEDPVLDPDEAANGHMGALLTSIDPAVRHAGFLCLPRLVDARPPSKYTSFWEGALAFLLSDRLQRLAVGPDGALLDRVWADLVEDLRPRVGRDPARYVELMRISAAPRVQGPIAQALAALAAKSEAHRLALDGAGALPPLAQLAGQLSTSDFGSAAPSELATALADFFTAFLCGAGAPDDRPPPDCDAPGALQLAPEGDSSSAQAAPYHHEGQAFARPGPYLACKALALGARFLVAWLTADRGSPLYRQALDALAAIGPHVIPSHLHHVLIPSSLSPQFAGGFLESQRITFLVMRAGHPFQGPLGLARLRAVAAIVRNPAMRGHPSTGALVPQLMEVLLDPRMGMGDPAPDPALALAPACRALAALVAASPTYRAYCLRNTLDRLTAFLPPAEPPSGPVPETLEAEATGELLEAALDLIHAMLDRPSAGELRVSAGELPSPVATPGAPAGAGAGPRQLGYADLARLAQDAPGSPTADEAWLAIEQLTALRVAHAARGQVFEQAEGLVGMLATILLATANRAEPRVPRTPLEMLVLWAAARTVTFLASNHAANRWRLCGSDEVADGLCWAAHRLLGPALPADATPAWGQPAGARPPLGQTPDVACPAEGALAALSALLLVLTSAGRCAHLRKNGLLGRIGLAATCGHPGLEAAAWAVLRLAMLLEADLAVCPLPAGQAPTAGQLTARLVRDTRLPRDCGPAEAPPVRLGLFLKGLAGHRLTFDRAGPAAPETLGLLGMALDVTRSSPEGRALVLRECDGVPTLGTLLLSADPRLLVAATALVAHFALGAGECRSVQVRYSDRAWLWASDLHRFRVGSEDPPLVGRLVELLGYGVPPAALAWPGVAGLALEAAVQTNALVALAALAAVLGPYNLCLLEPSPAAPRCGTPNSGARVKVMITSGPGSPWDLVRSLMSGSKSSGRREQRTFRGDGLRGHGGSSLGVVSFPWMWMSGLGDLQGRERHGGRGSPLTRFSLGVTAAIRGGLGRLVQLARRAPHAAPALGLLASACRSDGTLAEAAGEHGLVEVILGHLTPSAPPPAPQLAEAAWCALAAIAHCEANQERMLAVGVAPLIGRLMATALAAPGEPPAGGLGGQGDQPIDKDALAGPEAPRGEAPAPGQTADRPGPSARLLGAALEVTATLMAQQPRAREALRPLGRPACGLLCSPVGPRVPRFGPPSLPLGGAPAGWAGSPMEPEDALALHALLAALPLATAAVPVPGLPFIEAAEPPVAQAAFGHPGSPRPAPPPAPAAPPSGSSPRGPPATAVAAAALQTAPPPIGR
ncbi:hypothetical protein PAPYR_279 [Paratrimastix pyriformis]|uniref:Non-specific serine/threonine protein kinase n=1 Tax=Paratrimastix pyriformis TaxID=342808 RepID=A0ABQ8UVA3_9EUKA|nr:hypothetical protein PAPYR_279 [Paratrimastix pyriformis]